MYENKNYSKYFFNDYFFSVNAQFNAGLSGTFSYPINDFGGVNYSFGGELSFGYSINQRLDVNIAYSLYFVNSMIGENHTIYAYSSNIKYYFTKGDIRPYINLGVGKYYMEFDIDVQPVIVLNSKQKYEGFGLNPGLGVLIKLKFLDGLFVNTSVSYLKAMKDPQVEMINFYVGLVYYLKGTI